MPLLIAPVGTFFVWVISSAVLYLSWPVRGSMNMRRSNPSTASGRRAADPGAREGIDGGAMMVDAFEIADLDDAVLSVFLALFDDGPSPVEAFPRFVPVEAPEPAMLVVSIGSTSALTNSSASSRDANAL